MDGALSVEVFVKKHFIYFVLWVVFICSQSVLPGWFPWSKDESKNKSKDENNMICNSDLGVLDTELKRYEDRINKIGDDDVKACVDLVEPIRACDKKIKDILQKQKDELKENDRKLITELYDTIYQKLITKIEAAICRKESEVKTLSSTLKYNLFVPLEVMQKGIRINDTMSTHMKLRDHLEALSRAESDNDMRKLGKKLNRLINKIGSLYNKAFQKLLFSISVLTNVCFVVTTAGYLIYKKWFAKKAVAQKKRVAVFS